MSLRNILAGCLILVLALSGSALPQSTAPIEPSQAALQLYAEWLYSLKQHFRFDDWASLTEVDQEAWLRQPDLSDDFEQYPAVRFDAVEETAVQYFKPLFVSADTVWPAVQSDRYTLAASGEALAGPEVTLWTGVNPLQARSAWLASFWQAEKLPEYRELTDAEALGDISFLIEGGRLFFAYANVAVLVEPGLSNLTDPFPIAQEILEALQARVQGEYLPARPTCVINATRLKPGDLPGMRLVTWTSSCSGSSLDSLSRPLSLVQSWTGEVAGRPARLQISYTESKYGFAESQVTEAGAQKLGQHVLYLAVNGLSAAVGLTLTVPEPEQLSPELDKLCADRARALAELLYTRARLYAGPLESPGRSQASLD